MRRQIDWAAEIAAADARGDSRKALAEQLGVSPETLSRHATRIGCRAVIGRRAVGGPSDIDWKSEIAAADARGESRKALAERLGVAAGIVSRKAIELGAARNAPYRRFDWPQIFRDAPTLTAAAIGRSIGADSKTVLRAANRHGVALTESVHAIRTREAKAARPSIDWSDALAEARAAGDSPVDLARKLGVKPCNVYRAERLHGVRLTPARGITRV